VNIPDANVALFIRPAFTLGVKANVQPKSSIPIGAKVKINPKGFTLGVKAQIGKKKTFQSAPSINKC
jgi:hypothetical protein